MAVSVTMPRLGESVSEGTITRWLKKEGDTVEADEPLLEVSTDKVDTEIPSPASGVLRGIKVAEDETVEVGAELAVIEEAGEGGGANEGAGAVAAEEEQGQEQEAEEPAAEAEPEAEPEPEAEAEAEAEAEVEPEAERQPEPEPEPQPQPRAERQPEPEPAPRAERPAAAPAGEDEPSYVTPLVRKLAAEHGVELSQVSGTGVGGRIRKQDVLDAARTHRTAPAAAPAAPVREQPRAQQRQQPAPRPAAATGFEAAGRTEKLSRLRSVIATRMTESLQVSAQLTQVQEADVTRIARLRAASREDFEAREGVKLTFLPFFALAVCEALRAHPKLNASLDTEAGTVTYHDAVHLGIAVDTDRGLLVPVVRDASDLNLPGLARKIADLAERTRTNSVGPDELGGGTFTITNIGSVGALFDTPIINQPQVGILGTGLVVRRPAVLDDPELGEVIAIRHQLYLSLTYDHRLVDGADAGRFLTDVRRRLEDGEFAADLGL